MSKQSIIPKAITEYDLRLLRIFRTVVENGGFAAAENELGVTRSTISVHMSIKTSGTFMPVLIALAFIQTTLLTGLVGFLLIVAFGLMIRSYLSDLNLLLISRISAVIIVVIGIIGLFTLLSYKFGLSEGLTITFFPMIILAWTIERMSILWEEEGAKEVMVQGGGSLFVATLAYLAMSATWVQHWVFNFLGIHLVILATVLLDRKSVV